ncbi:MAG: hypothetical protein BalsKO_16380 [Balneolaceae bacterium]
MLRISIVPLFLIILVTGLQNSAQEVDEFWTEVSRTVSEGDFKDYSATFHEEAILVNGISGTSYPIADALAGWKKGFDDTKTGKMTASVEFKFTERFHSESTAFDTGIFKYSSQTKGGGEETVYIHFQGLLTKTSGEWKLMMENQISVAAEKEWNEIE